MKGEWSKRIWKKQSKRKKDKTEHQNILFTSAKCFDRKRGKAWKRSKLTSRGWLEPPWQKSETPPEWKGNKDITETKIRDKEREKLKRTKRYFPFCICTSAMHDETTVEKRGIRPEGESVKRLSRNNVSLSFIWTFLQPRG